MSKIETVNELDVTPRSAFLSYVREDEGQTDQLQAALVAAGISVWRDTVSLDPGCEWPVRLKYAIRNDALVFLPCFSRNSASRSRSYMNTEVLLAIEEFQQRRPGQAWFIPVRLDDCEIPDLEIGSGRSLSAIQAVDLFGDNFATGAARLIATILRLRDGSNAGMLAVPHQRDREGRKSRWLLELRPAWLLRAGENLHELRTR